MFRAYENKTRKETHREPAPEPDVDTRTRNVIQRVARRNHEQDKQKNAASKEDSVFIQSGYGESDSEDDCGGVRMPIEKDRQVNVDEVFTLPEKRKQDDIRRQKEMMSPAEISPYASFPSKTTTRMRPYDPYARDDAWTSSSSSRTRRRSRSRDTDMSSSTWSDHSRRREDRDRSRHHESRRSDRKKDKKHKRHDSRSSSESSRSKKHQHKSPKPLNRLKQKQIKYEFVTKEEAENCFALHSSTIIPHRKFDPENYSLGTPSREIAKIPLGFHRILGMEHNVDFFRKVYAKDIADMRTGENRAFYKQLEEVAAHVPLEKYFRKRPPTSDGYWKLIPRRDILNEESENPVGTDGSLQSDAFREEIENARKAVLNDVTNVAAILKQIQMEEELNRLNAGSHARIDPSALAERHLSIVEKSIKFNARNSTLQLIKCDLLTKMNRPSEEIIRVYTSICERFPHDPMVWVRYLDYIQYDSNVYTYTKMNDAFSICLEKVQGLVSGTLLSHCTLVTDQPAFRVFHLSIYIRYLKWLIHCAQTPFALASIQATMEYNFGTNPKDSHHDRDEVLCAYWSTGLPRIGDIGAVGIEQMSKLVWAEGQAAKLEDDKFLPFIENVKKTFDNTLSNRKNFAKDFIQYEREMQDVDARPKRTPLEESSVFNQEAADNTSGMNFWDPVNIDGINYFVAAESYESMDWIQPILELLGVKFMHSSGCFTTSEQVLAEWIPRGIFEKHQANFNPTPTYSEKTCLEIGTNILNFVRDKRHETAQKEPKILDPHLMRYHLAAVEMKMDQMEKDEKRKKKLYFYQLRPDKMYGLLKNVIEGKTSDMMKIYPHMKYAIASIASGKLTTWMEKAVAEQAEMDRLERIRRSLNEETCNILDEHIVTASDRKNLEEYRNKLWTFLEKFSLDLSGKTVDAYRSLTDPTVEFSSLQIQLYIRILHARQYIMNERIAEKVRIFLGMEIMEETEKTVLGLDIHKILHKRLKMSLKSMREEIEPRDQNESKDGVPEMPRVGALCEALEIAIDFVFLDQCKMPRHTIDEMTKRMLQLFALFDESQQDWKRGETEKYRDRVDLQFLMDTLISFFSYKNLRVTYNSNYQQLLIRASETFPCESKYTKKMAELFSTNRFQWMKLRGLMEARNQTILAKMNYQFDIRNDRRLLHNTLAVMYSTMKICDKIGEEARKMLFDNWKQGAMGIHDPVVWRLVMNAADRTSDGAVQETFIRSTAQCQWAFNLQLDYIYYIPDKMEQMMEHLLVITAGQPHCLFIENFDEVKTLTEISVIHRANQPNQPME